MKASFSKVALLQACQYWARDDVQLVDLSTPRAKKAMERGNRIHALLDEQIRYGDLSAPCVQDALLDPGGTTFWVRSELACGIRLSDETAHILYDVRDRQYPDGMFCGTADLVAVGERRLLVCDWKTGRVSLGHLPQVRALASVIATALAFEGQYTVECLVFYIVDDLRQIHHSADILVPSEVSDRFRHLTYLAQRVPDSLPFAGDHCKSFYCDHRSLCTEFSKNARFR